MSVLAYIGPEKNGPMKLYYDNSKDLAIVGKRKRWWFRVLNKDEYKVSGLPRSKNLDI